ncbi:MAG: hypothetical protein JW793_15485 [Acidobacteria bacterium]|nr:hypothetical protein [Acidobacteriota bacterium]
MIVIERLGLLAAAACLCLPALPLRAVHSNEKSMTPGALIEKHLKSIGTPEKIMAVRSWGVSGRANVEFILGATGNLTDGFFMFVSDGPKVAIKMDFEDVNYPGEHLAYDGREVTAAHITPGQRSPLADFVFLHNATMREGFLGGVLSTAWPLLRIEGKMPRMQLRETEIRGRRLYELEYGTPGRRPGNMRVKLFFDKENFRHVRTEYKVMISDELTSVRSIVSGSVTGAPAASGGMPAASAPIATIMESQPDSIYQLVEEFDDFASLGGLVLPMSYALEYSLEGHGATFLAKWTLQAEYYANNGDIDQKFFIAHK